MFSIGDFVKGEYINVPFTGVITHARPHSMAHKVTIITIRTDAPIDVFGYVRNVIQVEVLATGNARDNDDTYIRHDFGYMDYRAEFDKNTYPREALALYPVAPPIIETTIVNVGKNRINVKFGKMRKPQGFIVTLTDKSNFMIHSDKSIGMFDMNTGIGLLNVTGCYFHHLTTFLGAKRVTFPPEFVQKCHETFVLKGDKIGSSPLTGVVFFAGAYEFGGDKGGTRVPDSLAPNDYDYDWREDRNVYESA